MTLDAKIVEASCVWEDVADNVARDAVERKCKRRQRSPAMAAGSTDHIRSFRALLRAWLVHRQQPVIG